MSERIGETDILDRATDALRDDPVPPVPAGLIQRTQFAVRGRAAAPTGAASVRSPFRHPLLSIAAAVIVVTCGVAAYLALSPPRTAVETAQQQPPTMPESPADAPEITAPANDDPEATPPARDVALRGRVRFAGPVPQVTYLSMADDAHCVANHDGRVEDESVVVNADGTLRNVVVWVSKGLEGKRYPPSTEPAVLDQHGCVFTPHVVTVMSGQQLLVKNSDQFLHNVRAAASKNRPFNLAQPTVSPGTPLTFKAPERLFVKCDIHPWMSAFVHVMDNPFFAVSGDGGAFALPPGLPPGDYEVTAWHEVYGEQRRKVTVATGKPLDLQFTFAPEQGASDGGPGVRDGNTTTGACCKTAKPVTAIATAGGM